MHVGLSWVAPGAMNRALRPTRRRLKSHRVLESPNQGNVTQSVKRSGAGNLFQTHGPATPNEPHDHTTHEEF